MKTNFHITFKGGFLYKRAQRFLFLTAVLISALPSLNAQDFSYGFGLYKGRDFFGLRDAIPNIKYSSGWQKEYLESLSRNAFCDFKGSNTLLGKLLKDNPEGLDDSLKAELYKAKSNNHVNLFEYKDALECDLLVSKSYSAFLDEEEKDDLTDDINLWTAVIDAKPQTMSRSGEVTIQMERDIANLWNIPVSVNEMEFNFIFDTGANFSVIVESVAKKLGLKLIDTKLKVGTITGKKVDSKVAVCPVLKTGGVTVNNVVFLVLPDEALSFGFYKIYGIIGNPIIRGFGEITVNKDNLLTIPALPSKGLVQNLAFHGFTPVIQAFRGADTLRFTFDSGAMSTILYRPYFEKYRNEIEGKLEQVDINLGGAGGIETVKGYYIPEIVLGVNGKNGTIKKVSLLSELSKNKDKYFHGNFGQDYFKNYESMTFNFIDMFVLFK
ncbi:MAG: TIGR02281 family clan AA aspartic protease [Ignavibacteria bacterium]